MDAMIIYLFYLLVCVLAITLLTGCFHFELYYSWTVKCTSRPYLVNGDISS